MKPQLCKEQSKQKRNEQKFIAAEFALIFGRSAVELLCEIVARKPRFPPESSLLSLVAFYQTGNLDWLQGGENGQAVFLILSSLVWQPSLFTILKYAGRFLAAVLIVNE